jgi:hypothetical protein
LTTAPPRDIRSIDTHGPMHRAPSRRQLQRRSGIETSTHARAGDAIIAREGAYPTIFSIGIGAGLSA